MPKVIPTTPGQAGYNIEESTAFIAGFVLDIDATETSSLTLTHPEVIANLSISLVHIDTSGPSPVRTTVALPPGGSVSHYDVVAVPGLPANGRVQVAVNITETGGGTVQNESWELRVSAGDAALWTTAFGTGMTVNWLAADPVAALTAPANAVEASDVTLNATNAALDTVAGVLPVGLAPRYDWTYAGGIPIMEMRATTPDPSLVINLPNVYEPVPIQLRVDTAFADAAGLYTGFLQNASAPRQLTVRQRPQQIVLVIDRSGSMSAENRYENAKAACRVLVHLFAGLREDVHDDDRVGIVVFEDEVAGFRGGNPSTRIQRVLPLSSLSDAVAAIDSPAFDFGVPGTNTPIGDGLIAAIDMLGAAGAIVDQRFTIILLTDGQENSGTVALDPANAVNNATSFAEAVNGNDLRKAVLDKERCNLFTIALGPTADQNVLAKLAAFTEGRFQLILNPNELAGSFGSMLENSQKVNTLTNQATPTTGVADPDAASFPAGASAVYFFTEPSADRLVLSVLPPPNTTVMTDTIQLARWDGAAYKAETVDLLSTVSDRATSVSELPILGNRAVIHWRVIHGSDPTNARPLSTAQVLSYVDLHLRADFRLDKPTYFTGDHMVLTARIRHDDQPVVGARILATLTAPEFGLGEELSGLGELPQDKLGEMTVVADEADALTGRERRIGAMLKHRGWHTLPHCEPSGLFVDGTDELFDPEDDGNYTNTFARVFKEGTYTWRLFAEGLDANGQPFNRTLATATFAAVKVDPATTRIRVTRVHNHPSKMLAARVVITPMDRRGERLGPDKEDIVFWALRHGTFEHVLQQEPTPVFPDGTYQRVVLYQPGQRPTLRVKAAGTLLPEIDIKRRLSGLSD